MVRGQGFPFLKQDHVLALQREFEPTEHGHTIHHCFEKRKTGSGAYGVVVPPRCLDNTGFLVRFGVILAHWRPAEAGGEWGSAVSWRLMLHRGSGGLG